MRPRNGPRLVELSYRDEDGSTATLAPALTNQNGYFDVTTADHAGRMWRAQCTLPGGRQLAGPFIHTYKFPGPR